MSGRTVLTVTRNFSFSTN